jgi:uncharacterized protein (TIGR00106 family)
MGCRGSRGGGPRCRKAGEQQPERQAEGRGDLARQDLEQELDRLVEGDPSLGDEGRAEAIVSLPGTGAEEFAMAIAAVSISPVGVGVSVSRYVTAALRVVRTQDGVRYRLDPMFTTLEGDICDIFDLVRRMQEAVFEAGAQRVGTVIKIDDRRDRDVRMEDKVRAIEK